jgi:SAM-dependent methyltransferase
VNVVWHDLECGAYAADLPLWRSLAAAHGDPVLDVGAGTGRVALDLARHGHRVTALDREPVLLEELVRRAGDLELDTVLADAREFELGTEFALCVVPMQTIQLLGGSEGRSAFLRCARQHLRRGALLAVAIAEMLELYEALDEMPAPIPDICECDGVIYSSQPTAVRADRGAFVLERRREIVTAQGGHTVHEDVIRLDRVSPAELEQEASAAGLTPDGRRVVPPTRDYAGSTVVMLRG